ncbi:DUF4240 domain-containing protein [Solicola gregarius]|uniref:DUF4240 domain-containing protein n=1 Tax=Solicola gregarius TaxID=2908642 RepID=A0AA46YJ14_9ACTN|nr:hypothetical protein [Solicola gregarius]UYM03702.1 DUF4240 domain-containing protein [Solicola gregarius]
MRSAEFWDLIDVLGGTADEESVARLGERLGGLPARTVEAFGTALDERIDVLAESPAIPEELRYSETAEWFAAAIIAAGRPAYEKARRAHAPFDADDWGFEEAEDLLVVGENILEPVEIELDGVQVEWLSAQRPDEVGDPLDAIDAADPLDAIDPPAEVDALDADWDVGVGTDPQVASAVADLTQARTWRSWFCTQSTRAGVVCVSVEDDAETGLNESGRPAAREYRYAVPVERLLAAADRRAEMRAVLVEAWTAVADSVGWKAPPPDPGRR